MSACVRRVWSQAGNSFCTPAVTRPLVPILTAAALSLANGRTILCCRPIIFVSVISVAGGSLFAAGCGGSSGVARDSSAPTTSTTTKTGRVASAVAFAQCMRANGETKYPDPTSSGRTESLSQIDPTSAAFLKAYAACRKDAPSGQAGPPAPTAAELRAALVFARCMRTHGFPQFPDPLTAYGPGLTLGQGEYFPLNSTTDFQSPSPALRRAATACGLQLP